jgi:hypothetical protein
VRYVTENSVLTDVKIENFAAKSRSWSAGNSDSFATFDGSKFEHGNLYTDAYTPGFVIIYGLACVALYVVVVRDFLLHVSENENVVA